MVGDDVRSLTSNPGRAIRPQMMQMNVEADPPQLLTHPFDAEKEPLQFALHTMKKEGPLAQALL
jgi:hypothetical protein